MPPYEDEIMQQNVLFSKMIEYFLDKGIITQADILAFVADFHAQSEEEILKTKNPLHHKKVDETFIKQKEQQLDRLQRGLLSRLKGLN